MKPFHFKLDSVIMLRDMQMQEARNAYGEAVTERVRLEQACQQKSDQLKQLRTHISELRQSVFPASLQPHFLSSLQDHEEQLRELLQKLSQAETQEQQKYESFVDAKQNLETFNQLKQKRYEAYLLEMRHKEQKEMDDVVATRHNRKRITLSST